MAAVVEGSHSIQWSQLKGMDGCMHSIVAADLKTSQKLLSSVVMANQ